MPYIFCFQLLEYNDILLVSDGLLDFGFCTDCCRHHFVLKSGGGGWQTSSDQYRKKMFSKYAERVSGDLMKGLSVVRVDNYGEKLHNNCINFHFISFVN